MYSVVCVCQTSEEYKKYQVDILQNMCKKHITVPFNFICLSNEQQNCTTVPLIHSFKGWWSKIELFRPNILSGRILFLDLDTVVWGDITEFLTAPINNNLYMMTEFDNPKEVSSAVMTWDTNLCDPSHLYKKFIVNPTSYITKFDSQTEVGRYLGDQKYISSFQKTERVNSLSTQKIMSYRVHYDKQCATPDTKTGIVTFGGKKRRPWLLKNKIQWIQDTYK